MKISLKLTNQELTVVGNFLSMSFDEQLKKGDVYDRMVFSLLSELLAKLKITSVIQKAKYDIKISAASGLAFIAHCREHADEVIASPQVALLNKIISVIDQKTC